MTIKTIATSTKQILIKMIISASKLGGTFHSTKIPVFIYENWHALANKTASSGISIKEDELQSKVKTICRTIFFLYMQYLKQ